MTVVTGTVKYGKGPKGVPSKYNPDVMRYNILVDLDKPLPNGDTQQRAYFDEGTQPYEMLRKGDRVYVTEAGTWKAKLSLINEDAAAPSEVRNPQPQQQYQQKKKARNKYDVVEVDYEECSKFVHGAANVMEQCLLEARSIRKSVYGVTNVTDAECLEYDRALAVTIFIKATEGMQPTDTAESVAKTSEEPDDEDTLF